MFAPPGIGLDGRCCGDRDDIVYKLQNVSPFLERFSISIFFKMQYSLLGVNNTEGRYEVGDDHEGEEDQNEEVEVGGQQGEDKTSGKCVMLQSNISMDWSFEDILIRSPGYNVQDVEEKSPCSTAAGKEHMREERKKKLFKLKKWMNKFLLSLE